MEFNSGFKGLMTAGSA